MKRFILGALLACSTALVLTGCGPIPPQYQTTYTYNPPKTNSGRMCVMQCNQMKMMCQQNNSMASMQANMQNNQCQQQAQQNAEFAYKAYKEKRKAEGKPINKTINDFINPFTDCSSNAPHTNCDSNFRDCFVSCGGQVIPHTQCVAFCNQPQTSSSLVPQHR